MWHFNKHSMMLGSLYIEPKKTFKELINNNSNANAITLGKPTIKLEFETNEELVNFQERINNAQELEPVNFDKKRGFYNDELSGIDEEQEKFNFWLLIRSNTENINSEKYNSKLLREFEREKRNYKVNTPIGEIIIPKRLIFGDDRHLFKHIYNYFNVLKKTLETPTCIFKSKDKDGNNNNTFVKCFYIDGLEFISIVSPTTLNNVLKTTYKVSNFNTLWNLYKRGGKSIIYSNLNTNELDGVNNINPQDITSPLFVEFHLPCKFEDNFADNQIFNQKSLGTAENLYETIDKRFYKIVYNTDAKRVQFVFYRYPNDTVRIFLSQNRFKYNKKNNAFERALNFPAKIDAEILANNERFNEYVKKDYSGLNAPNDLYIISDTRLKSKKDLDEIKALQKYNIQPFKPEEYTNDTGVKLVLLKNIKKDTKRFQNRENAESSESVNRIINAVKKGDFNWAAFDPIVLWKDPRDGNIYVLSGHSRTRAFEILSEQGATVNGKDFNRIPAKFFEGSEQDAINFALNSNTLSTKETDVERAKYYRRLIGTMPEYKLKELAEQNEGKNANRILAYAHLRPGSYTLNALTRLQDSSTENAELVKTVADWIGRLFIQFPQLTLEHDKEIFNWLMLEGHYGVGAGKINNYQKLLDVIRLAVFRLQGKDGFESEKRLNLSNVGGESDSMKNYNEKLKQLNNEIKNANADLKAKRKEFLQRQKLDNTITRADIERALKPYNDNIINLQKQIIDLNANKSKYLDADKKQRSLFGISREANIWNTTKLDCRGFKPTYKKLNSYDSFFNSSKNLDELAGYGINDTIFLIKDCVKKNYKSCAAIAQHLKASTIAQSIFNVWYWLHENIKYNYDALGKEQLRTPERAWADRKKGVDCDCLSIFAYCILLNMNLKPVFEIAKFNGKNQYSHIYVVCNNIVLDRVWPTFNERAPFITEVKQFSVKIPTQLETLAGMF